MDMKTSKRVPPGTPKYHRPLKCRNWRTPREAFTALLHRHLLDAA